MDNIIRNSPKLFVLAAVIAGGCSVTYASQPTGHHPGYVQPPLAHGPATPPYPYETAARPPIPAGTTSGSARKPLPSVADGSPGAVDEDSTDDPPAEQADKADRPPRAEEGRPPPSKENTAKKTTVVGRLPTNGVRQTKVVLGRSTEKGHPSATAALPPAKNHEVKSTTVAPARLPKNGPARTRPQTMPVADEQILRKMKPIPARTTPTRR